MVQEITPIQYNFKILDFTPVSREISRSMLDDMGKYNLLENAKFSKDIKKLLLHHTIHCVCENYLKRRKNTPTILYFEVNGYDTKLHAFFGESVVNEQLHKIILKIKNILPVRVYIGSIPFDVIKQQIDDNTGEGVDFLKTLEIYNNQCDMSKFTFSRVRQYTDRHKLTFLNEDYFNRLKTKQLLFA